MIEKTKVGAFIISFVLGNKLERNRQAAQITNVSWSHAPTYMETVKGNS